MQTFRRILHLIHSKALSFLLLVIRLEIFCTAYNDILANTKMEWCGEHLTQTLCICNQKFSVLQNSSIQRPVARKKTYFSSSLPPKMFIFTFKNLTDLLKTARMFFWHACILCTRSELCASTSVCFDVDMMFWTLLKSKEEEKFRRRWTTFIGFLTCQTLIKLFLFTWMTSLSKISTATVKYSTWSLIRHKFDMKVWQILAATLTAASHDWKACELSLRSVLGCRKQCGVNRNRKGIFLR